MNFNIPPPPGASHPRYHIENTGDELIVHVAYRAGLDDEAIARRARKEAGVLAPVRVTLDDEPRWERPVPDPVYDVDRQVVPGARIVVHGNPTVWTVTGRRYANTAETLQWRRKSDRHEDYIARGGRLLTVDLADPDGGEAEVVLPHGYTRDRTAIMLWLIPHTDHWPVCSGCGQVWPCRDHEQEMLERSQEHHERSKCHRCGKTDGNQHVFRRSQGFPERRSYHTRLGACLNEAVRYANEHGWLLHDSHGWRTFRKAPDGTPRPIVQKIEYPERHGHAQAAVTHMDDISPDDRTVPLCGATVKVPKLTSTWGDVTCKRCLALCPD